MGSNEIDKETKKSVSINFPVYSRIYWLYVFTGFWKYETQTSWKKTLFRFYQITLVIVYAGTIICFLIDAILVRNDLDKLSFNMTSSVLVYVTMLKLALVMKQEKNMKKIFDSLNNHLFLEKIESSPEDVEILRKRADTMKMTARTFYSLISIVFPLRLMADTALDTTTYLIPMPYKEKVDPYYGIVYTQQVIVISHFLITVMTHDMVIYSIIIRIIAHFEVIERNILKIKDLYPKERFADYVPGYFEQEEPKNSMNNILIEKSNDLEMVQILLNGRGFNKFVGYDSEKIKEAREKLVFTKLKECIFHHQKVLEQIQTFQKVYSKPLVVQACGAVLLIGIVALQIMLISSELTILLAQQVLYVLTTMLNILYLCSFGTEVTFRSQETANALYDIPWYEMNLKNQKTVQFFIKKFKDAPQFHGENMVVINRVTYLKFLRTSYNMVAVLKNTY